MSESTHEGEGLEAPDHEETSAHGDDPTDAGDSVSLEDVQGDLEATRERLLRSMAEFENFKKRVDRERGDFRRLVASEILKEALPVVDNLRLAVTSDGSADDLRSGVELILQQMNKLLERFGVEEIPAEGEPFDPAVHDAIARFEDPSVDEHTVAEELQRGYRIEGRLLRPAMVRVAIPGEAGSTDGG